MEKFAENFVFFAHTKYVPFRFFELTESVFWCIIIVEMFYAPKTVVKGTLK